MIPTQELSDKPESQRPRKALGKRAGFHKEAGFLALLILCGCACTYDQIITPDKPCLNGKVICEDSRVEVYEGCE